MFQNEIFSIWPIKAMSFNYNYMSQCLTTKETKLYLKCQHN